MPTTYKDQFFELDPANPPGFGTAISFVRLEMVDQNDDGDLDRFNGDSVNGLDITQSWPGDTLTIFVPGQGLITYTGITFYLSGGNPVFTPTDGQVLQNGTFITSTFVNSQGPLDVGDLGPTCFVPGTGILTPSGERMVEDLRAGDLVTTRDNGDRVLRWIGFNDVDADDSNAPVVFEKGVLGLTRSLAVSPQHRMVISDWRAAYFFGHSEVFAAAKHLVNGQTVRRRYGGRVRYYHLLFGGHEILTANGALSESYFPGHAATRSDRRTQAEVYALFPALQLQELAGSQTARPVIRSREAQMFAV